MDHINRLEQEILDIKRTLQAKEQELYELKRHYVSVPHTNMEKHKGIHNANINSLVVHCDRLPKWAIERYSRQILLPEIGISGQEKLCSARVLIVGAGGLGCPAALYLAGAGVGEIGIVDYDTVDLTNIHRQVLHGERDQNISKVESAAQTLRSINSTIKITPYNVQLDSRNALNIASNYDVILDCTDNVPTRYLLNDLSVLAKIPLISGSALKMEGQLTVYGYRAERNINEKVSKYVGPCYRCVFPTPPPADSVGSCSSNGVAGPVPGFIGALQALEAIKLIVGSTYDKLLVERLMLFDGDDMSVRTVKLRSKNPQCAICSDIPTITGLIDYEVFCKAQAKEKKKEKARLNSQRRKEEKKKRMTGQSYYGFRTTVDVDKPKYVQDVPKSGRKMGPPCQSEYCAKGPRHCPKFDAEKRSEIFSYFWNELDWKEKRNYVRSLVDSVPPKRRRVKGESFRKGDSKKYHLLDPKRLSVCRIMFLNTLGIKEATVRCWLKSEGVPKKPKIPIKSLNVDKYIDNLPKFNTKCQQCLNLGTRIQYLNLDGIKNQHQLYTKYVNDMNMANVAPASRKTFAKVLSVKNLRIYKPKNENDTCDVVSQHNAVFPDVFDLKDIYPTDKNGGTIPYYYENQW